MKHVFLVHSAITEKVSTGILRDRNIENPIFLTRRGYNVEGREGTAIEKIYEIEEARYNLVKNWGHILSGDQIISELVGEPFQLYAPNTVLDRIRLLMSHHLCEEFSVLEEGLFSYCTIDEIRGVIPVEEESAKRKITHLGRLGKRAFCRDGYSNLFVTNQMAFPDRDLREVVPVEFGYGKCRHGVGHNDCILILESLDFFHREIISMYIAAMVEVLQRLCDMYDKLHYKLHPENYGNWQEQLLKNLIRRYGPDAEEIDQSACVEDVAIGAGADVVVNTGSTGLYCGLYSDGEVYSFHNVFASYATDVGIDRGVHRIENVSGWVPDVFWENVQLFPTG